MNLFPQKTRMVTSRYKLFKIYHQNIFTHKEILVQKNKNKLILLIYGS